MSVNKFWDCDTQAQTDSIKGIFDVQSFLSNTFSFVVKF